MTGSIVKRSQKLAFWGIATEGTAPTTGIRMQGFTSLGKTMNAKEYTRQYVDEEFETSDVMGYSPSFNFAFDHYSGNTVHSDLVSMCDNSATGADACRYIFIVDMSTNSMNGQYPCKRIPISVVFDSEGDSTDAQTYSGSFKQNGEPDSGYATLENNNANITFSKTGAAGTD